MNTFWLMIAVLMSVSTLVAEGRICTRIIGEKKFQMVSVRDMCLQQYEARCGWFSSRTCLFNDTYPCLKEMNQTVSIYRVVEDCCPGYYRDAEGLCVRNPQASESRGEDGKLNLTVSHGAYAGIVCGILFVGCVALLTALHYRKKKARQAKMSKIKLEHEIVQKQPMMSMDNTQSHNTYQPPASVDVST